MAGITKWWDEARRIASELNLFGTDAAGDPPEPRSLPSAAGAVPPIDVAFCDRCIERLSGHLPLLDASTPRRAEIGILREHAERLSAALFALETDDAQDIVVRAKQQAHEVGRTSQLDLDAHIAAATYLIVDIYDDHARERARIRIQFYRWQDEFLVSGEPMALASRIPRRVADAHGLFDAAPLVHVRALHACPPVREPDFPIDVVYTWVNHADPGWQALRASVRDVDLAQETDDGKCAARFINRDELRYSLRALDQHAGWVRNVHIATNCAPPPWVDLDAPGLYWVPHEAFLPADALPTFNSHAIESRLHHIPGLAEHFLYLNDDIVLTAPTAPSTFFLCNGMSKSFLEGYGTVLGDPHPDDPDYLNAARNGKRLLERAFGRSVASLHKHAPMALRRDVLLEIEDRFPDQIGATTRSRFRALEDYSTVSFLYQHYAYFTCRAAPSQVSSRLVKAHQRRYPDTLAKLRSRPHRPISLCLNDGGGSSDAPNWDADIREFLTAMFPKPSRFERAVDHPDVDSSGGG